MALKILGTADPPHQNIKLNQADRRPAGTATGRSLAPVFVVAGAGGVRAGGEDRVPEAQVQEASQVVIGKLG